MPSKGQVVVASSTSLMSRDASRGPGKAEGKIQRSPEEEAETWVSAKASSTRGPSLGRKAEVASQPAHQAADGDTGMRGDTSQVSRPDSRSSFPLHGRAGEGNTALVPDAEPWLEMGRNLINEK